MFDPICLDRLFIHVFRIPLRTPFRISVGEFTEKEGVLFEGRCGDVVGWGEASVDALPFYTSETVGACVDAARRALGPVAKAHAWSRPSQLAEALDEFNGCHFAKSGLEMVLWDILGQIHGQSLSKMLGGTRERVETGPSLGIKDTPEELVEAVGQALAAGWRRIKIKVMPGKDREYIEAVRSRFPDALLMVDANNAYMPSDMDRLAAWDEYRLLMIEQPLSRDDLYYHVQLCQRMKTAICLDESIEGPHDADCAIRMGAADIINVKPDRVGGLTKTLRIHDLAVQKCVPLWVGSRVSTGVAEAMRVAAASLPGMTLPGDAGAGRSYLADDIVKEFLPLENGCEYRVSNAPGLGVEVDREKLRKYLVSTEEVV